MKLWETGYIWSFVILRIRQFLFIHSSVTWKNIKALERYLPTTWNYLSSKYGKCYCILYFLGCFYVYIYIYDCIKNFFFHIKQFMQRYMKWNTFNTLKISYSKILLVPYPRNRNFLGKTFLWMCIVTFHL